MIAMKFPIRCNDNLQLRIKNCSYLFNGSSIWLISYVIVKPNLGFLTMQLLYDRTYGNKIALQLWMVTNRTPWICH